MTVLSIHAKQDYLEKVAKTRDPIRAISEFIWNALDADATVVKVEFVQNPLGGIQDIIIQDNGTGISRTSVERDFGNLGASWKRTSRGTSKGGRALHGKEGRGRLRFFSISEAARWDTVYEKDKKLWKISIHIKAAALEKCDFSEPVEIEDVETGTVAVLSPLKSTFDWLLGKEALAEMTSVFAAYILQYPDAAIFYNGHVLNPTEAISQSHDFPKQTVHAPNRTVKDLSLKVIEWNHHVESRKIHLGGESGIVLGSQPAHVTAPNFEYSAYANSAFFQEIANANLLELDDFSDPDFMFVMTHIRDRLTDYFRQRQAERSKGLIEELKSVGAYPYEDDPKDEIERRERQVFDIATHAVSSYSREFKKADNALKRMTLTLLKEALRHNPDALSNILRAVVNLPKNRQDEFSSLLQKTELGNIISASSLIADRVTAIEVLKGMVFSPQHRSSVKERGELDALIRDNTWMFGERFHITLPEVGLTRVMKRVGEELGSKTKSGKIRKTSGGTGRLDCFLGRSIPHPDHDQREFMIIELKRPSLVIGRKELDQLEDYVNALRGQPDFSHVSTRWNFFLVTGEYDDTIKTRITQPDRPVGHFLELDNAAVWVKTWSEVVRECESRLHFIQEKLRIEVSQDEIEQRISALKSALVKDESASEQAQTGYKSGEVPKA